jgi:predicted DNA binding CopG/RHH family protein
MSDIDKDKLTQALNLPRKSLLPGFDSGRFEQQPDYDRVELRSYVVEEAGRRDNRINIRISGKDLTELQRQALAEGIPTQSLIANIVHQYVQGTLVDISRGNKIAAQAAEETTAADSSSDTLTSSR